MDRRASVLAVAIAASALTGGCGHPAVAARRASMDTLACRESAGQQAADPRAISVNGVQSYALRGDTDPYDRLPVWHGLDGRRYLIWKVFLAVAPAARPYRIVAVTSPGTARLFYAGPARWGAVSGRQVVAPARRVRLPACGRRWTGYTGGILVTRPACVSLSVAGTAGDSASVVVPVLAVRCRPARR